MSLSPACLATTSILKCRCGVVTWRAKLYMASLKTWGSMTSLLHQSLSSVLRQYPVSQGM